MVTVRVSMCTVWDPFGLVVTSIGCIQPVASTLASMSPLGSNFLFQPHTPWCEEITHHKDAIQKARKPYCSLNTYRVGLEIPDG